MDQSSESYRAAAKETLRETWRLLGEAHRNYAECRSAIERLKWACDYSPHVALRQAVETMHRCSARHLCSTPVHLQENQQTLWKGTVETYHLLGHPQTGTCYAWFHDDAPSRRLFTVLRLSSMDTPVAAVRAALAAIALGGSPPSWAERPSSSAG